MTTPAAQRTLDHSTTPMSEVLAMHIDRGSPVPQLEIRPRTQPSRHGRIMDRVGAAGG